MSIAHFWSESYGQLYPMPKQLGAERLAVPRPGLVRDGLGRRTRHVYALTERGLAEFTEWLRAPVRLETPRSELLLKIFFGRHVPPSALARHVRQVRDHHARLLRTYAALATRLRKDSRCDEDLPYWLMTLRFGRVAVWEVMTP